MLEKNAFTLVEVTVVVALLVLLIGGAVVSLTNFFALNRLDTSVKSAVQMLKKARSFSVMRIKDNTWGVKFDAPLGKIIFFKGSAFAARDQNYDEVEDLPDSVEISNMTLNDGVNEVVFAMASGETNGYGSVEISGGNGTKRTITINKIGQIETN